MKCRDIIRHIEEFCPKKLAEDWDNVGMLVGDQEQDVKKVLVSLDVTEQIIDEAVQNNAQLIMTHHPILIKPVKSITTDNTVGKIIHKLIKNGISLYSAHTNLDIAQGGVNDTLVELLGLTNVRIMDETGHKKLKKFVVFVPEDHVELVRKAISRAGAGWIGKYSDCTFMTEGVGTFKALEGAGPFIGTVGQLEKVNEYRVETIFEESIQSKVIKAMLEAHPYEEVAYDIYPLENKGQVFGIGRVGELQSEMSLEDFVKLVKAKLGLQNARIVGNLNSKIKKVAVCSGSGMSLLNAVVRSKADVYLTGDVKYHDAMDALAKGIDVVDAGHYDTENIIVPVIKRYLEKLEGVEVVESKVDGNPFRTV